MTTGEAVGSGGDEPGHGYPGTARTGPLSYSIFLLARAHRGYAAALLRRLGLHPGQELLLMQLLDRDHQLQSELLDSVGLDHSTVSKSLRRMQEAGLLTRAPAAHDRRALVVSLTDQGRDMRQPLQDMWSALEAASVPALDPDTVEWFIRTATAIQRSVIQSASVHGDLDPSPPDRQ
jgi:MarR family transcriptional regulator, organic hydroperoxide resistance regulator